MQLRSCLLLLVGILAVGCNEYTTQVCSSVGKSDFPRFEQAHVLRMYDSANYQSLDSIVKYTKVAEGTYISDNNFKYSTCVVDGIRIMESYTDELGTFSLQTLTETSDGYESASIGYDKADLDREAIPYNMLKAQSMASINQLVREFKSLGLTNLIPKTADAPDRLVIDNSKDSDRSRFVKFGKPMGIQYRLYQQ